MSLISRLLSLIGSPQTPSAGPVPSDGPAAVAALLVHVARVDGVFDPAERTRLAVLFTDRLGLSTEEAARLLAAGEEASLARPDLGTLVEAAARDADGAERRDLLAMAYSVAAANGSLAEFEDDLIWRVGHLLGLDEAAIAAARRQGVPP